MAITLNNIEHDWGGITTIIDGLEITGYKAINYADAIEREKVMGAGRTPIGMTRGVYSAEQGSMTMYLKQHRILIARLAAKARAGDGWGDVPFDIQVRYGIPGDTHIDIVEGAYLAGNPEGGEQGSSALEREVKFDFLAIKRDGVYLVPPRRITQAR